jgi:hypothetical protein
MGKFFFNWQSKKKLTFSDFPVEFVYKRIANRNFNVALQKIVIHNKKTRYVTHY